MDRPDVALLRSLQLTEWFHLLRPETAQTAPQANGGTEDIISRKPSLLTDKEIVDLLVSKDLRVMPLIDIVQQLGSTSLDIRLGTSFEVYLPACRRTSEGEKDGDSFESRKIDLDYLEHIDLMPGQFMLAHSFEYIKFPTWLAGVLDGRSSYARLGLEVHMTASMIDPGFDGVVTLELFNNGPNTISLYPGCRIAQLRFTCVEEPAKPYSRRDSAKYRGHLRPNSSLYLNDPEIKVIKGAVEKRILFNRNPEVIAELSGEDYVI